MLAMRECGTGGVVCVHVCMRGWGTLFSFIKFFSFSCITFFFLTWTCPFPAANLIVCVCVYIYVCVYVGVCVCVSVCVCVCVSLR